MQNAKNAKKKITQPLIFVQPCNHLCNLSIIYEEKKSMQPFVQPFVQPPKKLNQYKHMYNILIYLIFLK